MTTAHTLDLPPLPTQPPVRWRRAWRALRALIADPDDTAKAIDVVYALGRREFDRSLRRLARSSNGRRLLRERPSLAAMLCDRAALERLPAESLGRAYLAYLERNHFAPLGLVELQARVQQRWEQDGDVPPIDPLRAWFRDRTLLAHDLMHVVTGYGTDDVGEATRLGFSLAQNGGRAQAFLTIGAFLEVWRHLGRRWPGYALRAYRRGRRADSLVALPWEELLPLRLDTVRSLARVWAPEEMHPEGIAAARLRARPSPT
jgi:ubiquinone biosynthesis protein COQ4